MYSTSGLSQQDSQRYSVNSSLQMEEFSEHFIDVLISLYITENLTVTQWTFLANNYKQSEHEHLLYNTSLHSGRLVS
jgi:hypothetical protein